MTLQSYVDRTPAMLIGKTPSMIINPTPAHNYKDKQLSSKKARPSLGILLRFAVTALLSVSLASVLSGCAPIIPSQVTPFLGIIMFCSAILLSYISSNPTSNLSIKEALIVGFVVINVVVIAAFAYYSEKASGLQEYLEELTESIRNVVTGLLYFAVATIIGVVGAVALAWITPQPSFWTTVVDLLLVTIGVQVAGTLLWSSPRNKKNVGGNKTVLIDNKSETSLDRVVTATTSAFLFLSVPLLMGFLLTLGLRYPEKALSCLSVGAPLLGICWLAAQAVEASSFMKKVGLYTTSFLLSYEVWLLVRKLFL